MILSCPVPLGTDWHVSFQEIFHFHPAPGNQRFEMTMRIVSTTSGTGDT